MGVDVKSNGPDQGPGVSCGERGCPVRFRDGTGRERGPGHELRTRPRGCCVASPEAGTECTLRRPRSAAQPRPLHHLNRQTARRQPRYPLQPHPRPARTTGDRDRSRTGQRPATGARPHHRARLRHPAITNKAGTVTRQGASVRSSEAADVTGGSQPITSDGLTIRRSPGSLRQPLGRGLGPART